MIDVVALITANMVISIVALVLSAIPLYLAVKFVGGETGFVKVIIVGLVLSLASIASFRFIGSFSLIVMVIATLFIYKIAFRLSFLKAFVAWLLQYIFVAVAFIAAVYLLGIAI